jgi:hypothetical protein
MRVKIPEMGKWLPVPKFSFKVNHSRYNYNTHFLAFVLLNNSRYNFPDIFSTKRNSSMPINPVFRITCLRY